MWKSIDVKIGNWVKNVQWTAEHIATVEWVLISFHLGNCRNAYDLWPIIDRIWQENQDEKQQKQRRLCNLLYTKCNLLKIYRNLIINMEICPQSGRGSEMGEPGARTRRCECNKTINAKRSRCRPRSRFFSSLLPSSSQDGVPVLFPPAPTERFGPNSRWQMFSFMASANHMQIESNSKWPTH